MCRIWKIGSLQEKSVEYLNHMRLKGGYEYNSTPYVVYTLLPLMNLADYAESGTIKRLAESIADNIALRYACGSYKLRQCAPFRRQLKHAENPSLRLNRLGRFVQFQMDPTAHHNDLLVYASTLHGYTLPTETYKRFAEPAKEEYYTLFAHEQKGSPEIYSGGPNYLLSAGGAYRGAGTGESVSLAGRFCSGGCRGDNVQSGCRA